MKSQIVRSVLLSTLVASVPAQERLSFCELARNPAKYSGHEVTVRASYYYGLESQELYCLECQDIGKAWFEIPRNLDDASERALRRAPKGAGIVNLTVRGVFYSGGHFGHENMWHHEFVAKEITNVVVVVKGLPISDKKKAAERRSACGGTDPR